MHKRFLFLILFALLLFTPTATAQEAPSAPGALIYLQRATFDPLTSAQGRQQPRSASTSPYYLVQFSGPVEATWLEQVRQLGGDVLGYVPDNAHIVRMGPAVIDRVASLPSVRWVGPYLNEYKLAPALDTVVSVRSSQPIKAYVVAFAGEDMESLAAAIEATGASIVQQSETALGPIFEIEVAAGALLQIQALEGGQLDRRILACDDGQC